MATTKPITTSQFESLMENICGYFCIGWSRNIDAPSADYWDTLSFQYDGSPFVGADFHLAYPYDRKIDAINYDVIEVRFGHRYPFRQDIAYRVTDTNMVKRLQAAVKEPYRIYREKADSETMPRSPTIRHESGNYKNAVHF